jgi:hypothetical protein
MNLENILAIRGKSGLYKLVAQSRAGVIVESIPEGKRFPVNQTGNVSALSEIAIYTYAEEVPLAEVYDKIAQKEGDQPTIDPKQCNEQELRSYMDEILPDYDEDRVYKSDLEKLFKWYNLLRQHDLLKPDQEAQEEEASEAKEKQDTPKDAEDGAAG